MSAVFKHGMKAGEEIQRITRPTSSIFSRRFSVGEFPRFGKEGKMKTVFCPIAAAFVLAALNLSAATLYVSLESTNPKPPFATWATAATNIQDAVETAAN